MCVLCVFVCVCVCLCVFLCVCARACVWQSRNAYRVLVGKPEGKRPLGRPRRRWEVDCDPGDWIAHAEDRGQWRAYVRAVMNLRIS